MALPPALRVPRAVPGGLVLRTGTGVGPLGKEMHLHKVPVIDKREKGNVSTSTSSRTSRANSTCHRLYDLSKSKRLEGKMRREEIIRRQMNSAIYFGKRVNKF